MREGPGTGLGLVVVMILSSEQLTDVHGVFPVRDGESDSICWSSALCLSMPFQRVRDLDHAWVGGHHGIVARVIDRCARSFPCLGWWVELDVLQMCGGSPYVCRGCFSGRELGTGLGLVVVMALLSEQLADVCGAFPVTVGGSDSICWSSALGTVFVGPEPICCEAVLFKRKGFGFR